MMQLEDLRRHAVTAIALGLAAILGASGVARADDAGPQAPLDPFNLEALSDGLVEPLDDDEIGAVRGQGDIVDPAPTTNDDPNRQVGMTPRLDSVRLPTPASADPSTFSRMQYYGRAFGKF